MSATIFYFTGTGNSLWVAKKFSEKLENSILVPVGNNSIIEPVTSDISCFVFPVYIWGVPQCILHFIKQNTFNSTYYLAIATNGGQPSNTLVQLRKFLKKEKSIELSGGFEIRMPSNYIPWGEAEPLEKQQQYFNNAISKIDQIIGHIRSGKMFPVDMGPLWQRIFFSIIYKMSFNYVGGMDKKFYADGRCNGCGTCVKVCPAENITLQNGKPKFNQRCEQCFACLQWCPLNALQYGKSTADKKRYHHPQTSCADIISSRNKQFIDK